MCSCVRIVAIGLVGCDKAVVGFLVRIRSRDGRFVGDALILVAELMSRSMG